MFTCAFLALLVTHGLDVVSGARVKTAHLFVRNGSGVVAASEGLLRGELLAGSAGGVPAPEGAESAAPEGSRNSSNLLHAASGRARSAAEKQGTQVAMISLSSAASFTKARLASVLSGANEALLGQQSFTSEHPVILFLLTPSIIILCCCCMSSVCGSSPGAHRQRDFNRGSAGAKKKPGWQNAAEFDASESSGACESEEEDKDRGERKGSFLGGATRSMPLEGSFGGGEKKSKSVWGHIEKKVHKATAAGREAEGRETAGKYRFGDFSKGLFAKVKAAIPE